MQPLTPEMPPSAPLDAAGAPRKPMATARRVALFEREIRMKLSTAAVDVLFEIAEVLSEGQRSGDGYFGSTMITIDLARAAFAVREACDAASARRVADLIVRDPRVEARARSLAAEAAAERAGARLPRLDVDISARAVGTTVQIDLDVEGELAQSSRTA